MTKYAPSLPPSASQVTKYAVGVGTSKASLAVWQPSAEQGQEGGGEGLGLGQRGVYRRSALLDKLQSRGLQVGGGRGLHTTCYCCLTSWMA